MQEPGHGTVGRDSIMISRSYRENGEGGLRGAYEIVKKVGLSSKFLYGCGDSLLDMVRAGAERL